MGNGGEGTGATTLYHAIMPAEMASVGSQDPNHISKTVPPIVQLGPGSFNFRVGVNQRGPRLPGVSNRSGVTQRPR